MPDTTPGPGPRPAAGARLGAAARCAPSASRNADLASSAAGLVTGAPLHRSMISACRSIPLAFASAVNASATSGGNRTMMCTRSPFDFRPMGSASLLSDTRYPYAISDIRQPAARFSVADFRRALGLPPFRYTGLRFRTRVARVVICARGGLDSARGGRGEAGLVADARRWRPSLPGLARSLARVGAALPSLPVLNMESAL